MQTATSPPSLSGDLPALIRNPWSEPRRTSHEELACAVLEHIEREVVLPILRSNDLEEAFEKAFPRFSELAPIFIRHMTGVQDSPATLVDARAEIEKGAKAFLGPSAAKTLISTFELADLVDEDVHEFLSKQPVNISVGRKLAGVASWFVLYNLSITCIMYAIFKGSEELRPNAAALVNWAFQYAEHAYTEWGIVSLDDEIKKQRPLVPIQ